MLLENGERISARALFEKYVPKDKISFERFQKVPAFELDKEKVKKSPNGSVKINAGTRVRAKFSFIDKDGMANDIIYAESANRKLEGGASVIKYEPRFVELKGMKTEFKKNVELAVFHYLNPSNPQSPFYNKGNIKNYEFIDNVKKAKDTVNKVNALQNALNHADRIKNLEAVIFAKALGIPKVDSLYADDPEVLYAHLKEYAMNNHVLYMEKAKTQVTMIEGKIYHGIDNGVFVVERMGGIRRWMWGKGAKNGVVIVDITNSAQDAREALKVHILSHLGEDNWLQTLDSAVMDESATRIAEQVLSGQRAQTNSSDRITEVETKIEVVEVGGEDERIEFTEDRNTLKTILDGFRFDGEGKNAAWGDVAKLQDAYRDGSVTAETARAWIRKNLGY